jgi:serine protease Do
MLLSLPACFSATSGRDGRDGKDGESITIYQIYEETKSIEGNESLTFDEFLREYLSYNEAQIASATDTTNTISRSLMAGVSVISRFSYTTTSSYTGISGLTKSMTYKAYKGSGVIVDIDREAGNALVVTNCHMIYQSTSDELISTEVGLYLYGQDLEGVNYSFTSDYSTKNDENYRIDATVIGASIDYDIAILKVENSEVLKRSDAVAASFAETEDVYVGDSVYTVGNASGEGLSASMGIISKDSESIELQITKTQTYRVLRTDAAVNHGNSGGALYNENGEIIGIINAKDDSSDVDNMGYAIPSSTVRRLVDSLCDSYLSNPDKKVTTGGSKAVLSVTAEITDSYSRYNATTGKAEIYETVVLSKISGSPASEKLYVNDVVKNIKITSSEGVVRENLKVQRKYYINDVLFSVRQGDTVTVTVERNGEDVDVDLIYNKSSYFNTFA